MFTTVVIAGLLNPLLVIFFFYSIKLKVFVELEGAPSFYKFMLTLVIASVLVVSS